MKEKKMVVKADTKKIRECFTCPICTNLFVLATTIPECLHTFCRKCIEDKIITEKLTSCPVCNVDLGVAPLTKLKLDYNLEDLRHKLFPMKPEKTTVAVSLQSSKKKEESQSSHLASSSSKVPFSPDLNQEAPLEVPNVPVLVEKLQSTCKPMKTFTKNRHRKNSNPKKFITEEVVSEQPQKKEEASPPIKILLDLNIRPEIESDEERYIQTEPAITPNGRETQDYVPTSGGVTVEVVSDKKLEECVLNKEVEEVPLLVSSDGDSKEVSNEKLKNNGKGKQECTSSRSRKKPGRKQKKNGKGIQECVTPRSGKISEVNPKYSPPVLRPRRGGKTLNSSAVKTMSPEAATTTPEVVTMSPAAATTTPEVVTISSAPEGTSQVTTMNLAAGSSEVKPMNLEASTSKRRTMNSAAGKSEVRTVSSEAGSSKVKTKNLAASKSKQRTMDSGAGTSEVRARNNSAPGAGFWFQLIATGNKKTEKPLFPQLTFRYLRITNRNTNVSYVKRYLMDRLNLQSEDEVEVWLRDEPLPSSLTVPELVRWWVHTTPLEDRDVPVIGEPGAKFVMPLSYSKKRHI